MATVDIVQSITEKSNKQHRIFCKSPVFFSYPRNLSLLYPFDTSFSCISIPGLHPKHRQAVTKFTLKLYLVGQTLGYSHPSQNGYLSIFSS